MQQAWFVQSTLRVTQPPYGSYSHAGSPAIDIGGAHAGSAGAIDTCFAPYDCRVVRLRNGANGECYIESLDKVLAPNGTVAQQNMVLLHAPRFRVKEGQTLRQGEVFYDEGGMQNGNPNALSPHVHMEVGFGPSPAKQEKNARGTWQLPGAQSPEQLLFLPPGTAVANAGGLTWQKASETGSAATTEEEDSMYRLYQVTFASEHREDALAEFARIAAAGGRPGLSFAASDGQYRVGNSIMASQDAAAIAQNLAENRFIG